MLIFIAFFSPPRLLLSDFRLTPDQNNSCAWQRACPLRTARGRRGLRDGFGEMGNQHKKTPAGKTQGFATAGVLIVLKSFFFLLLFYFVLSADGLWSLTRVVRHPSKIHAPPLPPPIRTPS